MMEHALTNEEWSRGHVRSLARTLIAEIIDLCAGFPPSWRSFLAGRRPGISTRVVRLILVP
jgi:hypothetical protein